MSDTRTRPSLDLSLPQLVGAAVAAATAATLSTRLGLVGTIAGAAFASVVSAIVTASVSAWLGHARDLVVEREPSRWRSVLVLGLGVGLVVVAFRTGTSLLLSDLPTDGFAAAWLQEIGLSG